MRGVAGRALHRRRAGMTYQRERLAKIVFKRLTISTILNLTSQPVFRYRHILKHCSLFEILIRETNYRLQGNVDTITPQVQDK